MKKFSQFMLTAVILGSVLTTVTAAESLSVLLQKGIFAEETEGNLDAAIKTYQQITTEAATNHSVAAQAQYRLGVCYQKKGDKAQAISVLNDLLKQFPAQAALGQKSREVLAALGQAPSSNITIRRVLADASGLGGVLTTDGKYISGIDWDTSDVVQFEVASGQTRRITNTGGPAAKEQPYDYQAFSRDGKQIAYNSYTKDSVPQLRVRNLDGSGLRTLYSEKGYDVRPLDWSPDAGSILAFREHDYSPGGGLT
jgi:tetratricopeptide (TPR) repeat protein